MKHIHKFNWYTLYENYEAYNVEGLNEFLTEVFKRKPEIRSVISELKAFIERSGCPKIRFESIPTGVLGISKTDECIVDSGILNSSPERILYVILHEVAHQYQYKKHGKDLALDIYKDEIDIEDAAKALMNIEKTADRLAIKKSTEMLNANGIDIKFPVSGHYLGMSDLTSTKNYIKGIRKEVSEKGYTTIEQVNDYIYNKIKTVIVRPAATYQRHSTTTHRQVSPLKQEEQVNRILDKISNTGFESLTDNEKKFLKKSQT